MSNAYGLHSGCQCSRTARARSGSADPNLTPAATGTPVMSPIALFRYGSAGGVACLASDRFGTRGPSGEHQANDKGGQRVHYSAVANRRSKSKTYTMAFLAMYFWEL
jgi:hypothetical protein